MKFSDQFFLGVPFIIVAVLIMSFLSFEPPEYKECHRGVLSGSFHLDHSNQIFTITNNNTFPWKHVGIFIPRNRDTHYYAKIRSLGAGKTRQLTARKFKVWSDYYEEYVEPNFSQYTIDEIIILTDSQRGKIRGEWESWYPDPESGGLKNKNLSR